MFSKCDSTGEAGRWPQYTAPAITPQLLNLFLAKVSAQQSAALDQLLVLCPTAPLQQQSVCFTAHLYIAQSARILTLFQICVREEGRSSWTCACRASRRCRSLDS